MSFLSVLKSIGKGSLKVLAVTQQVQATAGAQLIESAFLPVPVVKLINSGLTSVAGAQHLASEAVHSTELTGTQKMAIAMAAFDQAYQDYAQESGLPAEPDKAKQILQGAYDLLIKIQAPVSGAATSALPPSTPSPAN